MKTGILLTFLGILLLVAGCSFAEKMLTPAPDTGDSVLVDGARTAAPIADTFVPGLGEIILGAALLLQNAFILIKRRKVAKKTSA